MDSNPGFLFKAVGMVVKTIFQTVVLTKEKFDKFTEGYERLEVFLLQAELEQCDDKRVQFLREEIKKLQTDYSAAVTEYHGSHVGDGANKRSLLAFIDHAKGRYKLALNLDGMNAYLTELITSVEVFGMKRLLENGIQRNET